MHTKSDRFPSEGDLVGRYTNYFKVGQNAFEFIIDFGQYYPEHADVTLHTRIITNPMVAKHLILVLQESLDQYERNHGRIKIEANEL